MKFDFDIYNYIKNLTDKNKLTKNNHFVFTTTTGISNITNILESSRNNANFICVDDTSNGSTMQKGGGYFKRRVFTIFVLMKYDNNNKKARIEKLNVCREIFRQFHAKMIYDADELDNRYITFETSTVNSSELGEFFITGCTGLYFTIGVEEPQELIYKKDEWE